MPKHEPLPSINQCGALLCEPGWSFRPPPLRDFDLWFAWTGRGRLETGGRAYDIGPGSVFCLSPGSRPVGTQNPADRLGVCFVHFDWPRRPSRRPPLATRLPDVDLFERLLKHVVTLFHNGGPDRRAAAGQYLAGVLREIAYQAAADADGPTANVAQRQAIHVAARSIRERPGAFLSVSELAASVGIGVDHFARVFRIVMGVGPKEFCVRVRLDRARMLLRDSTMSVQAIAAALGYADVYFFSRQFKARVGMPPSRWRATAGG